MPSELPPPSEKRETLLDRLTSERLIRHAEITSSIGILDRIYEVAATRKKSDKSIENKMAFDRIKFVRKNFIDVAFLEADLHAPDDEAIALEEAVNEALFKPLS